MNKKEETIPKEISKLSEFYLRLSRKKEDEGDITGAVTELLRAQEEDSGKNQKFYMAELDHLKGMMNAEDEQLKAELIELYQQKALKTETADLYVNADKYAEELMKQLLLHNANAIEQLKDMAEEYDIHTDKINEYIGKETVTSDASEAGEIYDAEYVVMNDPDSSEYDDIKRLITLISEEETTDIELDTEEYLPGYDLFLSYFPERYNQRFEEDFRTGNLSDITDTIIQSLEKGDEDSGAFMVSLYTLLFEYSDRDENPWCEERAYYYLVKAHDTGAIDDRTYARILKNLAKAEKRLAKIKMQAEKRKAKQKRG